MLINLTKDEAKVLHDILNSVGGDPKKSARKLTDSTQMKLKKMLGLSTQPERTWLNLKFVPFHSFGTHIGGTLRLGMDPR